MSDVEGQGFGGYGGALQGTLLETMERHLIVNEWHAYIPIDVYNPLVVG